MNICFVSSEIAPLAKTGGLADVAAALPAYLHGAGHDVRVFVPRYSSIDLSGLDAHPVDFIRDVPVRLGGRDHHFTTWTSKLPGTDLSIYLIDCPDLYRRDSIYASDGDEHLRFAMLSRAALESCQRMGWRPDVAHCNDWHAALVPLYIRTLYRWDELFRGTRTILTIHNLAYQGVFPASAAEEVGLGEHLAMLDHDDLRDGRVNFLKTGLLHSDVVTTVSRTYAREIQTPEYGEGLDPLLRRRAASVVGIVNGVDCAEWSPDADPLIAHPYSRDDLDGKAKNREALLEAMGLDGGDGVPVFGIVSRLTAQKGIDLYRRVLPDLLASVPSRVVALGSGDEEYERFLTGLQQRFPGKAAYYRGFHNRLAHLIEAGADMFLMPSKFEPCGLNQMYSLRYGTPPIVRRTGGLADTVEMFDPETGEGDGFVFEHFTSDGLRWAVTRALEAYRVPKAWRRAMRNGMAKDFSWDVQGREYVALYRRLVNPT